MRNSNGMGGPRFAPSTPSRAPAPGRSAAFGLGFLGLLGLLVPGAGAYPAGMPLSDFGPGQVATSLFYESQGFDVFDKPGQASSILSGGGLALEYAPWTFLQAGLFGGGAEYDVELPEDRRSTTARAFNSGFAPFGGGTLKFMTPRFFGATTRLYLNGNATYFRNETEGISGNLKSGFLYGSGAGLQVQLHPMVNLSLGGLALLLDGSQESANGGSSDFGATYSALTPTARGSLGLDLFLPGKTRSFLSFAFSASSKLEYDDRLGPVESAVSVALGVITDLKPRKRSAAGSVGTDEDEEDEEDEDD